MPRKRHNAALVRPAGRDTVPGMDTINRIAHATRRFSVLLKAAFIAGLVLVLLIPLFVVQAMVSERESRRAGVEAEIIQSRFENYSQQRNVALENVTAEWIFFLDADERATPALGAEIRAVTAP